MIATLVLALGTLGIFAVSWRSLRYPWSHGFFRFFAAEAVLGLVVLNTRYWFAHPGTPHQILSWLLLAVSAFLAIHGFYLLRRLGQAAPPAPGSPLYGFENTALLVTTGAYRYIRHPMYAAGLFLSWGAAVKDLSLPALGLALVATASFGATAKAEEAENLARFGAAYRHYMGHTRLFIPFVL
jgi:protein-S-isoprenylcysteine O-methyltransferase Ste14